MRTGPGYDDVFGAQCRENRSDFLREVGVAGGDVLVDCETTDLHGILAPLLVEKRFDSERHLRLQDLSSLRPFFSRNPSSISSIQAAQLLKIMERVESSRFIAKAHCQRTTHCKLHGVAVVGIHAANTSSLFLVYPLRNATMVFIAHRPAQSVINSGASSLLAWST